MPDMTILYAALDYIADVGAVLNFAGLCIFAIVYGRFYNWRKTRAGRANFFLVLAFLSISLTSFLTLWVGEYFFTVRPWFRFGSWAFAAFAVCYTLYALLRSWNQGEDVQIPRRDSNASATISQEDRKG